MRTRLLVFCGMNYVRDYPFGYKLDHCPPGDLAMDIGYDGCQVGSPTITRFIGQTQPLFGCSGHIHESPYRPCP